MGLKLKGEIFCVFRVCRLKNVVSITIQGRIMAAKVSGWISLEVQAIKAQLAMCGSQMGCSIFSFCWLKSFLVLLRIRSKKLQLFFWPNFQKNSNVARGQSMHQVWNYYILLTLDLLCLGISCKSFGLPYVPFASYQFTFYMIHCCLW